MRRGVRTGMRRPVGWGLATVAIVVAATLSVAAPGHPSPAQAAANPVPQLVPSAPLGPVGGYGASGTPVVDSATHTIFEDQSPVNTIMAVDDLTGKPIRQLTAAAGMASVGATPLAIDESTGTLYLASDFRVEAFNASTGAEIGLATLPSTGYGIASLAVDPVNHHVLVGVNVGLGSVVYEVAGDCSGVLAQVALTGYALDLAVDGAAGAAFVAEGYTGMARIDLSTFTVAATSPQTGADELFVDHATGQLFARVLVPSGIEHDLEAFSETTLALQATPVTAIASVVGDPTRGYVYASSGSTFSEVDTSTDTVTRTIPFVSPNRFVGESMDLATGNVFDTSNQLSSGFIGVLAAASSITSTTPPAGSTWIDYSFPLAMSPAGVYWTATGTLPPGLTLDQTTGVLSGIPTTAGSYTYTVTGRDANGDGSSATYTQTIGLNRVVDQVFGADRYQTSVSVSQDAFPNGAPIVFVASGVNFPDALSAAPAATHLGGPVLLTAPGVLPAPVADEITRLHPSKVVIAGGTSVVSPGVQSQLSALVPNTVRWSGSDRFATSRVIDSNAFSSGFSNVFVATGTNFPDALAAGAAAGAVGFPILLVNGGAGGLDSDSAAFLSQEGVGNAYIAGGVNAVSDGVANGIFGAVTGTVGRFAGGDRYATAEQINEAVWDTNGTNTGAPTSNFAFLVTGLNFPDALAAGPWAGGAGAPMYLVTGGCVPNQVIHDLNGLGVSLVVLVGGPAVLTAPVSRLTLCDPSAASAIVSAKAKTDSGAAAPLPRLDVASHARRPSGPLVGVPEVRSHS